VKHGEFLARMIVNGLGILKAELLDSRYLRVRSAPQYHSYLDHFMNVGWAWRGSACDRLAVASGQSNSVLRRHDSFSSDFEPQWLRKKATSGKSKMQ
jgi:hypothetical protein